MQIQDRATTLEIIQCRPYEDTPTAKPWRLTLSATGFEATACLDTDQLRDVRDWINEVLEA